jgi:hypothetical protein
MAVKRYNGSDWDTVAGLGAQGAAGTNGTNGTDASPFAAGKNKIINGDFNIWQRGTSINVSAASYGYGADRWGSYVGGGGAAVTMSRQSFTPGTAPVSGYEGNFFLRYNRTTTGNSDSYLYQRIENVTTFAGQTVTVSFWAKAGSAVSFGTGDIYFEQDFGTGGSSAVLTSANTSTQAISTSWTRYSFTVAIPSISGKTIGTNSHLGFVFEFPTSMSTLAFDIWGVQVEAGSVATAFQTATGTIQGELAACQYYYQRFTNNQGNSLYGSGFASSSTAGFAMIKLNQAMRTVPSFSASGNFIADDGNSNLTVTSFAQQANGSSVQSLKLTYAGTGMTAFRPNTIQSNGGFFEFSAEL